MSTVNSYTIKDVRFVTGETCDLVVTYPQGCSGWLASPNETREMCAKHSLLQFGRMIQLAADDNVFVTMVGLEANG